MHHGLRSFPALSPLLFFVAACFPGRGVGPGDTDPKDDSGSIADHSDGWDHGLAAKLQDLECIDCHGTDLTGGSSAISCDACHPAGWRSDCTFCHGGADDSSGAPPDDMDGTTAGISFPEHGVHIVGAHPTWGCEQCHADPGDILSPGHIFVDDDSPAIAELTMAGGLSPSGSYDGGGSCGDLYCHGDGAGQRGSASSGQAYGCGDCHADAGSARELSGRHGDHLHEGVRCGDCHADTASGNDTISGPDHHVNGRVDVVMDGLTYNGSTCDGSCHGEGHHNERWEGGDDD